MRLIASDLDGTIVGHDGKISDRTIRAFDACRDAGIEIVFVTGRPPRWLDPLQDQLGHTGTVICSNGAVVYDLGTERVLSAQPLANKAVFAAEEIIKGLYPRAAFAAETIRGFHLEPGFLEPGTSELHQIPPRPLTESLREQPDRDADHNHAGNDAGDRGGHATNGAGTEGAGPALNAFGVNWSQGMTIQANGVVKFLAKEPSVSPDEFLAGVRPAVGHLVSVTHSSPGVALLEMSRPGVNKAATLQTYAAALGIEAAEVTAFGDMPNDIQMLGWAGQGYAMADGHPAALAAARLRAPAFAEDGVAQILEAALEQLLR